MYDITVEDNHNFLAGNAHNGFLVHNCTPGGSSLNITHQYELLLAVPS